MDETWCPVGGQGGECKDTGFGVCEEHGCLLVKARVLQQIREEAIRPYESEVAGWRICVATLEGLVEEWQAAAGIGVDSDGITPAMAEAHWGKLAARVSEAEQCFELECPCCGQLAANWVVSDGDDLLCGCDGQISCCSETRPYANAFDCECGGDGNPEREESKLEAENQPGREDFPWFEFLQIRRRLIVHFRSEGDSWEAVADKLSCEPMQVQLIHMSAK